MATATSAIRSAVISAVDALTGWRESSFAPDLFGRDPDRNQHLSFAVSCPETTIPTDRGRQRSTEGAFVSLTVIVQWAYRLRGDAQSADYSAALDAEADMVAAVLGISSLHVVLVGPLSRRAAAEGWILGTARFAVSHHYPLT